MYETRLTRFLTYYNGTLHNVMRVKFDNPKNRNWFSKQLRAVKFCLHFYEKAE